MGWLLTTVVESAVSTGVVERSSFAHVCVDSTVMEKNIAHPPDSALLEKNAWPVGGFHARKQLKHSTNLLQTGTSNGAAGRTTCLSKGNFKIGSLTE